MLYNRDPGARDSITETAADGRVHHPNLFVKLILYTLQPSLVRLSNLKPMTETPFQG